MKWTIGVITVLLWGLVDPALAGVSSMVAAEAYVDNGLLRTPITLTNAVTLPMREAMGALDLSALSPGIHVLTVRIQDQDGNWSAGLKESFYLPVGLPQGDKNYLVAAEAFFDSDPGLGAGIPIAAPEDGTFDASFEQVLKFLPLTGLNVGIHTLTVRVKDRNGNWSAGLKESFYLAANLPEGNHNRIAAAETFFDNDPGLGAGTPIAAPEDGTFDTTFEQVLKSLPLTGLSFGVHKLSLRFRDISGNWSSPTAQSFYLSTDSLTANTGSTIVAAEYSLNGGAFQSAPAEDGAFGGLLESINITVAPPAGSYYSSQVRFHDSLGRFNLGTIPMAPIVVTNPASNITSTSATLNGTVTPNGSNTSVNVDLGLTTNYGTTVTANPNALNANLGSTAITANIAGLNCNTSYHYRLKAANQVGMVAGVDQNFTTSGCSGYYTVTPSVGTGGMVNPNIAQTVANNAKATFTITPNTGYIRGSTVSGTCPQGTWSSNIWTTGAITGNCTVNFSFTPSTYNVTPSAGSGGTISPAIVQTVAVGTTTTFIITPNSGYTASVSGTCGGSLSGNTYTTNAIITDCTVNATFQKIVPACTSTWSTQTSNTTNILSSITWSGSQFVAVGDGGIVITSPEGVNWTNYTTGTTRTLNSVTWSGTQFVSVSGYLDKSLIYTSPDGITWTEHVSTGNPVLHSIVWNGEINKLVAVGEQGAVLTSGPDAQTWNTAQVGQAYTLNAITSTGSLQVAVGTGSTILTSADGITWTLRNAPVSGVNLRTVIWNGSKFIAAGNKPMVFSSGDGITWTSNSTPANLDFYNIEWNGSKYIAVGSSSVATSSDGLSWTIVSNQANPLRDIAWSGTNLVAVGDNGTVLRYCVPNQEDVITAVSYDSIIPASLPKDEDDFYVTSPKTTGLDYLVNAKVFSAQTGGSIVPGGQLSLSLNGTLKAYLFDSQIDLIFRNLQTGDVITGIYSGTDKYRRSTGSVTIGNTYALTVATTGTGTGTVTTNQVTTPDILCGAGGTNCSQQYATSTPAAVVTLIATAAAGSSFSNWGGACSGTTTTCSVTMSAAKTVTATFTANGTPTSYTVTPIIGKGGTVTPSTPQTVNTNATKSFTVIPKTGYIKSPKGVMGSCPKGNWSGNIYTTGAIIANCSINFNFFCSACIPSQGGWRATLHGL